VKAEPRRPATLRRDRGEREEAVFHGLGVAPGIAIGPAHRVETGTLPVPEYAVALEDIAAEKERFAVAVAKAQKQVRKLKVKVQALSDEAAEELGYLLDAHLQMLSGSRLVRGVLLRIEDRRQNAEAAVAAVISDIAEGFAEMDDAYLAARMVDIRAVGDRILRHLTQTPYQAFSNLPPGTVVVAEDLTPADTALMDPQKIAGFTTALGGAESHTAIMARSLGLPAVLGVAGVIQSARSGAILIVDGSDGRVIVDPTAATLAAYRRKRRSWLSAQDRLKGLASLPSVTRDGHAVVLQANLELPRDLDGALAAGAAGVGLLRTEFFYMNRPNLPDEDEQTDMLLALVRGMGDRPITVRTLDLGGDKLAQALGPQFGHSTNPALGLRAIRLGLREPKLLETQLAAILRAGVEGRLRILLPMISTVSEVTRVHELLDQVAKRLKRRGVAIADPIPPIGVMIEVPGAALSADALALAADFFAIGTNDLTMYTLAIDRADEQVAHLYNPLHPAVLRLIQFAVEAALRARIPVSVCGEVAGDPRFTPLLLGLGVRELSMAPASIPRVKRRIRHLELLSATERARAIMGQWDEGRITQLVDQYNAKLGA
jgi:phosphotransferase system enzyme I (PtsI)